MRPSLPGHGRERPLFIAHRGASDRALENSPSAFALALAEGADMIEFDVRMSSDGVPVVFHDGRTGRTARRNVRVSRTPAARLARVLLKNGEAIPTFAEVLERIGGKVPLNVESKVAGAVEACAKALRASAYRGAVLFSSGLRKECLAARALRPELPCGLVTRRPSASDIAFCLRHGLSSIHPSHRLLTVLRMRKVVASGIALIPYTVDNPSVAFRLIEAGAAGVFSNRAEYLKGMYLSQYPNG
jgi:glycerophosphoryl diester phosphodiesterase